MHIIPFWLVQTVRTIFLFKKINTEDCDVLCFICLRKELKRSIDSYTYVRFLFSFALSFPLSGVSQVQASFEVFRILKQNECAYSCHQTNTHFCLQGTLGTCRAKQFRLKEFPNINEMVGRFPNGP